MRPPGAAQQLQVPAHLLPQRQLLPGVSVILLLVIVIPFMESRKPKGYLNWFEQQPNVS